MLLFQPRQKERAEEGSGVLLGTVWREYKETGGALEEFCGRLPQVSEDTNTSLDRLLTLQELHAALHTMQNQEAPGIDGLSGKFYKAYWDILAPDLLDVFNESLSSGTRPAGELSLLPCPRRAICRT